MPRPNKPRTIGAEDRMRASILRWLEENERSEPWLARKMSEAGCAIGQPAVWKALHRGRSIYLNEAVAIAAVFGVTVTELAGEEA